MLDPKISLPVERQGDGKQREMGWEAGGWIEIRLPELEEAGRQVAELGAEFLPHLCLLVLLHGALSLFFLWLLLLFLPHSLLRHIRIPYFP